MLPAQAYLSAHEAALEEKLRNCVKQAVKELAPDPAARVGELLLQSSSSSPTSGTAEVARLSAVVAELQRENAKLAQENERLQEYKEAADKVDPTFPKQAAGELKGVHGMNVAIWKMGRLQHEPPKFEYFGAP